MTNILYTDSYENSLHNKDCTYNYEFNNNNI